MITRKELKTSFIDLGITRGDIVLLHSSFSSIGGVEGGPQGFIDTLLELLGENGTLATPAFGEFGVLSDLISQDERSIWSDGPGVHIAAIGKDAAFLCRDHIHCLSPRGAGSPYTKIAESGGKIMLVGVDQDRNTTIHSVEEAHRLPYLTTKRKRMKTKSGKVLEKEWRYCSGPHRDFIGIDPLLARSGIMTKGTIGRAITRVIQSSDMIRILSHEVEKDPALFLSDNPNCADGRMQRAALFKQRLKEESFNLVTTSSCSGVFTDEIINNLTDTGIETIELDIIKDRPFLQLSESERERIIEDFRAAGIRVSGLRIPYLDFRPCYSAEMVNFGISSLTLPLAHYPDLNIFAPYLEQGVSVFFENTHTDLNTTLFLINHHIKNTEIKFAFNPATLVFTGTKPFLEGYIPHLRKFIDKLYLNDGSNNGHYSPLMEGNAEIRELVSILRCRNFDGDTTFGYPSNFKLSEISEQFIKLLDSI